MELDPQFPKLLKICLRVNSHIDTIYRACERFRHEILWHQALCENTNSHQTPRLHPHLKAPSLCP